MQTEELSLRAIDLLDRAKQLPKGDHNVYASCMRTLYNLHLGPPQYETMQRKLIDILEV